MNWSIARKLHMNNVNVRNKTENLIGLKTLVSNSTLAKFLNMKFTQTLQWTSTTNGVNGNTKAMRSCLFEMPLS